MLSDPAKCKVARKVSKTFRNGIIAACIILFVLPISAIWISPNEQEFILPDTFLGTLETVTADTDVFAQARMSSEEKMLTAAADIADDRYTVTITFYKDEPIICSTPEKSVGELLDEIGIVLDDSKRLGTDADTVIREDITIPVNTVEYGTVEETKAIPYSTKYHEVRTIPKGSTSVVKKGANGKMVQEYRCEYVNGEEVSRELVKETQTVAPTTEVVNKGVGGTVKIGGKTYSYSYYLNVRATTYTGGGKTATGLPASEKVIAVDPKVIALGSKVYVNGSYGDFGIRTAADTGGSIKGNKIDVYLDSDNPLFSSFGVRQLKVYILD